MRDLTAIRERCAQLDRDDPMGPFRDRFDLPEGVIYLDGNSLGPLPRTTAKRLAEVVEHDWATGLIGSWNHAGWVEFPTRLGDKIARLVGAAPGEVIAADSTSVNLFKVLSAALSLRPGRPDILVEADDFPTDAYIAEGVVAQLGKGGQVRRVARAEVADAVNGRTGVVLLCHVNYRTGELHDLTDVTRRLRSRGALVCWDLSHSVGALPVDLTAAHVDFAVGCGYKFLNGGPGAPAFVFAATRHLATARQPLEGWFGHARPFTFTASYEPGDGILRFACGTPPVLGLAALECGVDVSLDANLTLVRKKATALSELLIELVDHTCSEQPILVLTPRDPTRRGSQVSVTHPNAHEVCRALGARGVVCDFRPPDIVRFGITPLYLRFVDVFDAVARLAEVLDRREWDQAQFRERLAVT